MEYPKINHALVTPGLGASLILTEKVVSPLLENELLIKVHAASINPVDIQLWRSGLVGVVAGEKGMGRDYSGTIIAVGSNVKGWNVGDEVFGFLFKALGPGTFSEYINVLPSSGPIARKPDVLTHEQAASIPLVVLTAYACLGWLPPQTDRQRRVIVRGASGGTGMWVVQLAKVGYNCHVTAICSSRNAQFVKELGADEVIDYTSQNISTTLQAHRESSTAFDLLIDCVGGTELVPIYPQLLHTRGAYVTIVGDKSNVKTLGGPITYFTSPAQCIRYIKGYIWGPRYACISLHQKSSYLEEVARLVEKGEVKTEVQEVLDGIFDERESWRKAVQLMEDGRVRGKVVLRIP
ncbi:hypothetical protein BGZ60DRAFT_503609 [Tricladium varicosporioides]|nr:hypothetical protein BGZ60DRAFT_503609 [Hymenoscyphus varicosporioides]